MKFKITIEGMHCSSCANNVERALMKIKGIKSVAVSVLTKKAFVESENPNKEEIIKAIERFGYKVSNWEEN
jgi:copper chaperone CopZ